VAQGGEKEERLTKKRGIKKEKDEKEKKYLKTCFSQTIDDPSQVSEKVKVAGGGGRGRESSLPRSANGSAIPKSFSNHRGKKRGKECRKRMKK